MEIIRDGAIAFAVLTGAGLVITTAILLLVKRAKRQNSRGLAFDITFFVGVPLAVLAAVIGIFASKGCNFSKGRLLRLRGRPRTARRGRGEGWRDEATPSLTGIAEEERAVLVEGWLASAELEHASVPAFGRLAEILVSLGAPSELVERSHLAALDEIRHARRCFALASSYGGGAPRRPGELPELRRGGDDPRRSRSEALAHLACASLSDGALGEGTAAAVAREAALLVEDPIVRATWEMIAVDEARHAELAWDTLAWCLDEGGAAVARALDGAIAALPARESPRLPPIPVDDARLEQLGFVAQPRLERITRAVIVATAERARALLDGESERSAA